MPLAHSSEDLTGRLQNHCQLCTIALGPTKEIVSTPCSHRFHRTCMFTWLESKDFCPSCEARLAVEDLSSTSQNNVRMKTRSQTNRNTESTCEAPNTSRNAASLVSARPSEEATEAIRGEERMRNLVTATVAARTATLAESLEQRLSQLIEVKLEQSFSNIMARLNLNPPPMLEAPRPPPSTPIEAHNVFSPPRSPNSPRSPESFNRRIDNFQLNESAGIPNSSRAAQLISNWGLKFDGSPRLSVDNFIYRIECLVKDTLGSNFQLLCDHAQSLFVGDAKDWYWRYRRSVNQITWPSLCQNLRTSFDMHISDTDIRELIRNRKQGPTETFDEYKNAILKYTEKLTHTISEVELVELLQRGLRAKIREQLLYVPIRSVAELRRLCILGENLRNEVSKVTPVPVGPKIPTPRRHLNEITQEDEHETTIPCSEGEVIEEVAQVRKLTCWNCRADGHRYRDCLAPRTVFCYGCGAVNTYRPSCIKCQSGNVRTSETSILKPRPKTPQ